MLKKNSGIFRPCQILNFGGLVLFFVVVDKKEFKRNLHILYNTY